MDVTVILVTYQHERFLTQAIESVLAQRTRGAWELLISEDGSTDGTRAIVDRFAAQHPDRVRVFLSDRNLNSNEVTLRALRAARGRFVAFLDGDDFWTSNDKLQLQVEFLDRHAQCTMCFHNVTMFRDDNAATPVEFPGRSLPSVIGLERLLEGNCVPGCSAMIRREVLQDIPAWYEHAPFGDWPLYLLAAEQGAVGFLPQVMGAYRLHAEGFWSGAPRWRQLEQVVGFYQTLSEHLAPIHRRRVRRLLATRLFELGIAQEAAHEYWQAIRSFLASFRARPLTRDIRPGRRAWHLACSAASALASGSKRPLC